MTRLSFSAVVAALAFTAAHDSLAAQSKADQCITANDNGIDARAVGKLHDARTRFIACAERACPAAVRTDCERQLAEVNAAIPTVIFEVKDGAGHDLDAVTMTVDDGYDSHAIDGTEMELDPGKHTFVFTTKGEAPVSETFVFRVGEKARRERITIGSPPPLPVVTEPARPPVAAPETRHLTKGAVTAGLVTGSVGLAGIVAGSVFGALAFVENGKQSKDCATATNCTNRPGALGAWSDEKTDSTVSTVAFIAGGALLVTGATLLLVGPKTSEPRAQSGWLLVPSVSPAGGGVLLRGEF